MLLCFNQMINSIECNTTIVTNNASTTICVWQSSYDLGFAGFANLRRICVIDTLIMCLMIFSKDAKKLIRWLIAICSARFCCHCYATIRHERTLEGLLSLKSNYFLKFLIKISWFM